MNLKRLLLYFNTVKHLKSKQFLFNFIRRLFNKQQFINISDVKCRQLNLSTPIKYVNKIDSESLRFLNERRNFDYVSNWACMDEPKLWRYNLHYFDYLLDDGASEKIRDNLIDDWIKASHNLKEDAWEPYPISLRLVNWVKYFTIYKNNSVPETWLQSLYQQAHVLYNSIEYHILANHYLKNGKGLIFSGAYLKGIEPDKWFNKGKNILLEEAEEQILDDGGHYEKSPMYHSIFIEDYLDVINLMDSNSLDIGLNDLALLREKTRSVMDFLSDIVMPDGEIPLFNDSAFKIAPHPDELFDYSGRIIEYKKHTEQPEASTKSLDDSGYYVIKDGNNMCVIDCGSVGPEYQPGHTHCDILSYELVIGGERLVVDTGVYDYGDSENRRYCRSTAAHNTVSIDGKEQSEIWGTFRVARRATVHPASLIKRDNIIFSGSYVPYWAIGSDIVHYREIVYNCTDRWSFKDIIKGSGEHKVESYIHLHPDIEVHEGEAGYSLVKNEKLIAELCINRELNHSLSKNYFFPEFGKKKESYMIAISVHTHLPATIEYVIKSVINS